MYISGGQRRWVGAGEEEGRVGERGGAGAVRASARGGVRGPDDARRRPQTAPWTARGFGGGGVGGRARARLGSPGCDSPIRELY